MTSAALSPERIRELYKAYRAEDPYSPWRKDYLESLERFLTIEDQALATPAIQQELWSLRRVATLGSGDAVNVQGAWTDDAVVRRIVELRLAAKEPDDHARARRLQAHFNDIISLVVTHHSDRRPFARLSRLFAVLVPRQCHAAFSTESRTAIARTLRGATGDGGIYGHVLDRARRRAPPRPVDPQPTRPPLRCV